MGPVGGQLGALLWKNWLCRLRNPVSGRRPLLGPSGWDIELSGPPHPAGNGRLGHSP